MAVTSTGALFKALTFDNTSSRNYGVYITGQAVYNAPQRDVEMITIPARNGAFALDNGRFENIEVTYPAGIFADNEEDFAQAISDFRNFLCSKRGYCRLEDEYNPDEYRMAIYKSGLEVTPAQLKAGEFEIVFDCKPQRWLTSGETEVAVDSGDTLTNPTLFDASPLLEIEGTGDIEFNGYTVSIESSDIGEITLPHTETTRTYTLDVSQLNTGDVITLSGLEITFLRYYRNPSSLYFRQIVSHTCSGLEGATLTPNGFYKPQRYSYIGTKYKFPNININYGTSWTGTVLGQVNVLFSSGRTEVGETITITYDGDNTITWTYQEQNSPSAPAEDQYYYLVSTLSITAYSTKPYDYGTIFCDTDIGEFYRIEGGEYISMNHVGDLGSDLPTLAPGTNTVTYDNTITELNITPRWWKI